MATSTFGKNFAAKRNQADSFVSEMKKTVPPTLKNDFSTKFIHLTQDKEISNALMRALKK